MEENKILVIYINVVNLPNEDINNYCHEAAKKIIPDTFHGEIIVIPVLYSDTRIDCINPKYITDKNLMNEHTEMMKTLEKELQNQLKLIKEGNNE